MSHKNILINGRSVDSVNCSDRGLCYGDGLFETIAVRDGRCCHWPRHWQRLQRSASRLDILLPEQDVLVNECDELVRDCHRGVLKLTITRGLGQRGYRYVGNETPTRILVLSPWPNYPENYWVNGIDMTVCRHRLAIHPVLAGIKHLNRLDQVLARSEWRDEFAEGLMLDAEGYVIEGVISNVFIVLKGQLWTPRLNNAGVAGIMREVVLERALKLGISAQETGLRLHDVYEANECFMTNSLIGIWPVRKIETTNYRVPGPITSQLIGSLS